jgi:predicted MFS family arabinose efflux permease
MLASLAFMALPTKRMSIRAVQAMGITVSVLTMIPYCFIHDKLTLCIGNGLWGFGYMTGSLATLSLAAAACPRRAEGFVFAALLSASNFATSYGEVWGGRWYEGFAAHRLWVMVLISMSFSLAALALVPLLPRRLQPEEPAGAAPNRGVAG